MHYSGHLIRKQVISLKLTLNNLEYFSVHRSQWHYAQGSRFPDMTQETRLGSKLFLLWDRILPQNFEAVLAVIVELAGDPIFAKFCQDALQHILRHPLRYILQVCTRAWRLGWGEGGVGMEWRWGVDVVGMEWAWGGDGQWRAGYVLDLPLNVVEFREIAILLDCHYSTILCESNGRQRNMTEVKGT